MPQLSVILQLLPADKLFWGTLGENTERVISADDAVLEVSNWNRGGLIDTTLQMGMPEKELVAKYITESATTFSSLTLIGDQQAKFDRSRKVAAIRFVSAPDSGVIAYIPDFHVGSVYNTNRTTAKQRATTVVTTFIIPILKTLATNFKGTDVKYVAASATYGSMDFADRAGTSLEAEVVLVIVPIAKVLDFIAFAITDQDLLDTAQIYTSDRSMVAETKRIKVVIE